MHIPYMEHLNLMNGSKYVIVETIPQKTSPQITTKSDTRVFCFSNPRRDSRAMAQFHTIDPGSPSWRLKSVKIWHPTPETKSWNRPWKLMVGSDVCLSFLGPKGLFSGALNFHSFKGWVRVHDLGSDPYIWKVAILENEGKKGSREPPRNLTWRAPEWWALEKATGPFKSGYFWGIYDRFLGWPSLKLAASLHPKQHQGCKMSLVLRPGPLPGANF